MIPALPLLVLLGAVLGFAFAATAQETSSDWASGDEHLPPMLPEPVPYEPMPEIPLPEPVPEPPLRERSAAWGDFQNAYALTPFHTAIREAEGRYDLPPNLLARLLWQESRFNPNALGAKGELGIAQFMPATAAEWEIDPNDPASAIPGAAIYLRQLALKTGNWFDALVAYNWGIGRVMQRGADAAPPQTIAYANSILMDSEA